MRQSAEPTEEAAMTTQKRRLRVDHSHHGHAFDGIDVSRYVARVTLRAVTTPGKSDVEAGMALLADTAKSTNTDVELFNAIVAEAADAMRSRDSYDLGLTRAEAELLIESGEFTPDEFDEAASFIASGGLAKLERSTHLRSLANTYTSAEAAALLGRDPSSLRPRKGVSRIYSFSAGPKRLFPKWQFVPGSERVQLLPNLAKVIPAIPSDWTPVDVEGFMTTPQEDLRSADEVIDPEEWLTPAEWLAAAKDPDAVVKLLEEADIT